VRTCISTLLALLLVVTLISGGCRRRSNAFVIALGDNVRTIDPIGSPSVDAASERVRTLIFNTLVKKDDKFDYVGELASDIKRSDDGLVFTFTLRDGVKFHDGRTLSSADVKYTLDLVFSSNFAKSASFYEGSGAEKKSLIKSVEAPDAKTVVVTLTKPWVGLLSNLVPVPMIPKDSYESQKTHPLGTGPFVFGNYDNAQQVCDVEAFPVVYADEVVDAVRTRLLGLDGVLVWVDPITEGRDRSRQADSHIHRIRQVSGDGHARREVISAK